MPTERPAFGQRLAELAELGVIEFRPEPLDAIVERRLKTIWEERSCPHCGADSLHALSGSGRIWCGRCDWKTTYTRGTPFYDSELTPGEFLIAFILYNLGTGERYSFNTVVEILNDELGTEINPEYVENPIPEDVYVYDTCADYSRIAGATGWEPAIDFEEGIRRVCRQYTS